MAKAPRGSNLRKPWAWAAAVAALGLVLASSTAIYVINPGVRLPLPWWTAIAAPAAVYALVLPLCVPGLGAAGWLGGFVILAVLHAGLGAATAWLYSIVTFTSIEQAVAPAFWGFPPALVLEMVGSLVMTLPFLDALAPRQAPRRREPDGAPARAQSRRSRAADARPAPAAAPRTQDDAAARQAWGRGGGRTEVPDQPALARPVDSGTVASLVAAVASGSAAAVAAPAAPVVAPPGPGSLPAAVEAGHDNGAAPEPRALEASPVAAPPLAGINGSAVESHEALESRGVESAATAEASPGAETALPDYRQALRELFGAPGGTEDEAAVEEAPPPAPAEPPADAAPPRDEPVALAEPAAPAEAMIRIPFERIAGQLPPGAFRQPVAQVGALLSVPETLLVPQALIVPQLGEGVVQVAWEAVAGQFPADAFAVPMEEIGERIVNGRLLLPLDAIVRQLPPDMFAASMARGPVELPGIEGFPAPFRPEGYEERGPLGFVQTPGTETAEPKALAAGSRVVPEEEAEPEPVAIEVPDADLVAQDLGLAALPEVTPVVEEAPEAAAVDAEGDELARAERESTPESPAPAAAAPSPPDEAEAAEPENVVEIDDVPSVIDLDRLLEGAAVAAPVQAGAPVEPAPAGIESPNVEAPTEPVVRIPFERVLEQLPLGAFSLPLAAVGARLASAGELLVPQALVLPQLGEGVVQVAWDAVASQFPPDVLALPAEEIKERLANGRLMLPLDEIVRQIPPELFVGLTGRGPVVVPGLESFPAPFKPREIETPATTAAVEAPAVKPVEPAAPPALAAESETAAPPIEAAEPKALRDEAPTVVEEAPAAPSESPAPVEPPLEAQVAEPGVAPAVVAVRAPAPHVASSDVSRLAALLAPWDALHVDEARIGDFTVISAGAAGLAGPAVAAVAARLVPCLSARSPWPVEQATLRSVGGLLVLTPVGAGWGTGAAIAVGLRSGGTLARLEMLARRAATGQAASRRDERGPAAPEAEGPALEPAAPAPELAEHLDAFGRLGAAAFRDPAGNVLVHCFHSHDIEPMVLAVFGVRLARVMAAGGGAGAFGPFHSAVLRSGTRRLEVRRLPSAASAGAVLVVGGADTGRPGLARLQVERVAARLLAP